MRHLSIFWIEPRTQWNPIALQCFLSQVLYRAKTHADRILIACNKALPTSLGFNKKIMDHTELADSR